MKWFLFIFFLSMFGNSALACTSYRNDVWVLVNQNSEDSKEIGRYYAEKRCINQDHIIPIFVQVTNEISTLQYDSIRLQVAIFLQNRIWLEKYPEYDYDPAAQMLMYGYTAYLNYLKLNTDNNYFVTTKDLPYRAGSYEPASVDALLAKEFNVAVGRLDGLTKDAAKNLVDRAIKAEQEGVAGKFHVEPTADTNVFPTLNYVPIETNLPYDQTSATPELRYVLGLANESRAECAGNNSSVPFYLLTPNTKPPIGCTVKFIDGKKIGLTKARNNLADSALMYFGFLDGQQMYWPEYDSAAPPIEDNPNTFVNVLNWKRDANSAACGLCKDSTNPELCRQQSTDIYKELDTQCVGVANGFMGYNHQSYPVSFMASWPTGWGYYVAGGDWDYAGSGGGQPNVALPEVVTNDGDGDNFSLKFTAANKGTDKCFAVNASTTPINALWNSVKCDNPKVEIYLQQRKNVAEFYYTPRVWANGKIGQKFTLRGRYKYKPAVIGEAVSPRLSLSMQLREKNTVANYTSGNALNSNDQRFEFVDLPNTSGAWRDFAFDYIHNADNATAKDNDGKTITQTKAASDVIYNGIRLAFRSQLFTGELQFDNFSLTDQDGNALPLINADFSQGHLQNSVGDHASFFLSRLNGTVYLGSMSHYIDGGHALTDSYSSFMEMYRGRTLGEATKTDLINSPSGLIYGDPLFIPASVRIDPLPKFVWANTAFNITGSARNGAQTGNITLDYCKGTDFFICDKDGAWINIAASQGAKENTALFTVTLPAIPQEGQPLVLRLQVNSVVDGKTMVLNSFATTTQFLPDGDINHNGISNLWESFMGFDFEQFNDSNKDTLDDAWEVAHFSTAAEMAAINAGINSGLPNTVCDKNCVNLRLQRASKDENQNRVNDFWENFLGLNSSKFNDSDRDALDDGWELFNSVTPQELNSINQVIMSNQSNTVCNSTCVNQIIQRATTYGNSKVAGVNNLTAATLHVTSSTETINQASIYVDASASNIPFRNGSVEKPFASIAEASSMLKELKGGYVTLAPGNYEYSAGLSSGFTWFMGKEGARSVDVALCIRTASGETILRLAPKDSFYNLTIKRCSGGTSTIEAYDNSFLSVNTTGVYKFYIKNNLFSNSILSNGWITMDRNTNLQISSSTLVSPGPPNVINFYNSAESLVISNSILFNAPVGASNISGASSPSYVQYNLLNKGLYNGINGYNIKDDPLFVNAPAGNFHVLPTSPTINKGNPADDYSNEPEPNGYRIDLGAYGNTSETPAN